MATLKGFIRRLIIRLLQLLGYDFDKISLEGALERSSRRGVQISTVIDIGASNGMWSAKCQRYFPEASYFLVDAQAAHEPALQAYQSRQPNVRYLIAAAGEREGEINFDASELLGGLASDQPFAANNVVVPMTTVDKQVAAQQLQPPFLLKLDTHGYEVPVFNGAAQTLTRTNLIVVEVYNFDVAENSLRFQEMVRFLGEKGFRPVDLCDPLHRPLDQALWQFDLFFERQNSPTFQSNAYEAA